MLYNVPLNRWTIGALTVLILVFGDDFVAPILKVISIMTSPYLPAG